MLTINIASPTIAPFVMQHLGMKPGSAQNTGQTVGLGTGSSVPHTPLAGGCGGVIELVREKILARMAGAHVEVTDESRHHAGHAGSRGYAVSHIKVTVISDCFAGMSKLRRWRLLHEVLADEVKMVHSVSFFLATSDEQAEGGAQR